MIVTGKLSALDWQVVPQGQPCGKGKDPTPCPEPPDDPPDDPPAEPDPTEEHPRPVPIGVSTGHPAITAGTIGARVTDGTDVFALSNNHVYAATNFLDCTHVQNSYDCEHGQDDPVIQPGTFDGGTTPADDIGTLADFKPLKLSGLCSTIDTDDITLLDFMDAAIALSTTALLGNSTPSAGYGTPQSTTMAAALNMKVKKFGRTTGQTKGTVAGVNATVSVGYGDAGVACFTNQIVITPGGFSAGGDSGSLVVADVKGRSRDNDGKPVALLFAGSPFSTIISPIGPILTRFGVMIDGN